MRKTVLIDTSFLIALVDDTDQYHELSKFYFENAVKEKWNIIITEAVLIEFGNSLAEFTWRGIAFKWISEILESPEIFTIILLDIKIFRKSLEIYGLYTDKRWSLCDFISFTIMKELDITESLSFDHHFEQSGFMICKS
jgi:hypothetical protein